MVAANHHGRGVLLNVSGVTAAQTSEIFQDHRQGVNKTVVCIHSNKDCTTAGAGAPLVIEVEDPTGENTASAWSGFQLTSSDVAANTLLKIIIDAGCGSRIRCTVTPDSVADIKIWAWSAD